MLAAALALLLKIAGSGVVSKLLGTLEKRADNDLERERIQSLRATNDANNMRDVIVAGMSNKMFWVPWSIAAITTSVWYGWGVADSAFNGALPDVAALPPQLKEYADAVWKNIFYVGGAVKTAETLGSAYTAARRNRPQA